MIPTHDSIEEKLLDYSEAVTETGCWIWLKGLNHNGYGTLTHRRKTYLAHKASYQTFVGQVPVGKLVLHTCDVSCCINPAHLYAGTQKENVRDCETRGRAQHPRGSLHGKSKLNEQQVLEIKARLKGEESFIRIAKDYCVRPSTIEKIYYGYTWKWLLLK